MSRRSVILGALMSLTMVLFSCQKQEDETIPVLKVPQAVVSAQGGGQSLEVAATSSWTLSVDYSGAETGWIELAQTAGSAGVYYVRMNVTPNDGENPRSATLTLKGITLKATAQVSQAGTGGSVAAAAPMWMELPALDRPELYFFTHDWEGGQYISRQHSGMRNYSFYWDPKSYVSHWVAYPLNKGLRSGNYGRYDSETHGGTFIADPILTSMNLRQPNLSSRSYGGSDTMVGAPRDGVEGWARGHQIPSYDRQDCEGANKATYYVTNITPQQYDFNGKIWATLEGLVRKYGDSSDTLYVVTGCDISNSPGWSGSNSGVAARVPGAYYKALLRLKNNTYSAAAYYLPHSYDIAFGSQSDLSKYLISVSDLEKKVGVDFFAILPTVVGKDQASAIEKADPKTVVSKW